MSIELNPWDDEAGNPIEWGYQKGSILPVNPLAEDVMKDKHYGLMPPYLILDEAQAKPNPYHRIGTLEGAIKGALPYFEKAVSEWASTDAAFCGNYDSAQITEAYQAIANLKELIGNNQ